MDIRSTFLTIVGWLFSIAVLAIGLINTFWGYDPGFGVFLIILSFVYFPPVHAIIRKIIGFPIPGVIRTMLGFFII